MSYNYSFTIVEEDIFKDFILNNIYAYIWLFDKPTAVFKYL